MDRSEVDKSDNYLYRKGDKTPEVLITSRILFIFYIYSFYFVYKVSYVFSTNILWIETLTGLRKIINLSQKRKNGPYNVLTTTERLSSYGSPYTVVKLTVLYN